ncbi:hypothetical protein QVD17_30820 [Tagetes erecta]|uniref:Uncharacterized protein n=1 Tax=Tagetes erecta TaxID=13708 RepID=A0AAD8NGB1_TARER|nr:hypothetical protein QVD17_30820 [Tagetes erecta]
MDHEEIRNELLAIIQRNKDLERLSVYDQRSRSILTYNRGDDYLYVLMRASGLYLHITEKIITPGQVSVKMLLITEFFVNFNLITELMSNSIRAEPTDTSVCKSLSSF